MKAGDLVKWNYFGKNHDVGNEPIGLIVSDYWEKSEDGTVYKNVLWMKEKYIRPIHPQHLELFCESR
tara:strand:- start:215 stop:415 length:201 start_codon:yes stop_codon:yes gene_type:complete